MAKAAIRAITANTAIARRFFAAGSGADVFISPSSYADVYTTKESGGLMFSCFTSE
jgi:stage V sporulation protein SpoVS